MESSICLFSDLSYLGIRMENGIGLTPLRDGANGGANGAPFYLVHVITLDEILAIGAIGASYMIWYRPV
jgi:hypothetical protein